ncbi:hypothetical protein K443DRAFT_673080 [Laccaria amethystina LaAM-08-1]|uniref:Uncharacterized protein n=1 Tax=Laccaria amethystina LaAM-08-1 TaxID=1095629 RepID=A0A0C9X6K6_9AGAR|nr:hypothetical protein K443DRAFT_673080 [Laccaria amethystina LaAM-08-1]
MIYDGDGSQAPFYKAESMKFAKARLVLRRLCLKRKVSGSRKRMVCLMQSKTHVEDVSGSC